jgi:hypothetical protein
MRNRRADVAAYGDDVIGALDRQAMERIEPSSPGQGAEGFAVKRKHQV